MVARIIRTKRTTIFGFGEGETERIFLKHLRSEYSSGRASVSVYDAGGKDVRHIIDKAIRVRGDAHFDYSFILLDTDREWPDVVVSKARKHGFELLGSTPCIEGVLLSILDPNTNYERQSSDNCKRLLQANHLGTVRIFEDRDCKRLLLRAVLEAQRGNHVILNRLIEIMEGQI